MPQTLKAQQAPLQERLSRDARQGADHASRKGSIDDQSIACKVETGRAIAVAGLHPATGGSGMELAPATCCSKRWSPAPA